VKGFTAAAKAIADVATMRDENSPNSVKTRGEEK
jgi:hypothetical protein